MPFCVTEMMPVALMACMLVALPVPETMRSELPVAPMLVRPLPSPTNCAALTVPLTARLPAVVRLGAYVGQPMSSGGEWSPMQSRLVLLPSVDEIIAMLPQSWAMAAPAVRLKRRASNTPRSRQLRRGRGARPLVWSMYCQGCCGRVRDQGAGYRGLPSADSPSGAADPDAVRLQAHDKPLRHARAGRVKAAERPPGGRP